MIKGNDMTATDYGNTFEFAATAILRHWRQEHNGYSGGDDGAVKCMTCRGLAYRVLPTVPYAQIIKAVWAWATSAEGRARLKDEA